AAQAAPCDGGSCPSAQPGKVGKPLQLGQFMRTTAKSASRAVKPSAQAAHTQHASRPLTHAVKTNPGKPKNSLAPRKPKAPPHEVAPSDEAATPLATDAAAAFAAQDVPDVRVVAADELNDIDLAAGPAPETVGSAPDGEKAVVDVTSYNDIDR